MPTGSSAVEKKRLTVREAAKLLRVEEETIRRYIRSGKLKAKKERRIGLSQVWTIAANDLKAFTDHPDV